MTLWQEQRERQGTTPATTGQPRSRREARDAERRANETGDLSGVHPSNVYDLNSSGNNWDTLSRRAASQLTDAAADAERRTGRRASGDELHEEERQREDELTRAALLPHLHHAGTGGGPPPSARAPPSRPAYRAGSA